jgi:hypothetical protein
VPCTKIAPETFGSSSRPRIRRVEKPADRAARMYSRALSRAVSAVTMRAKIGTCAIAMARIRFPALAPRADTIMIASRISGNDSSASMSRMRTVSTSPRK